MVLQVHLVVYQYTAKPTIFRWPIDMELDIGSAVTRNEKM